MPLHSAWQVFLAITELPTCTCHRFFLHQQCIITLSPYYQVMNMPFEV